MARVAQKWADQCADVDYQNDIKRKDPLLFHDAHAHRKIGITTVLLRRITKLYSFLLNKCLTFFICISEKYSNWQGVGQNVARDIARGEPGKFDAHKLIGHWFNQILYFDPEAVKSFGFVFF